MPFSTPSYWKNRGSISSLLLPAAYAYRGLARMRNAMITPQELPVPVICVGNATAGGAGKTPTVLALAELLAPRNMRIIALTRGYGGMLEGPLLVDATHHTATEVGDEPLLLSRALPVVVAKDRLAGALFAVQHGAEAIIMDDGLQNPLLKKTLSLLVVDAAYGFGNGRLIPAGPLREPVEHALEKADAVIAIGGQSKITEKPVIHAQFIVPPEVRQHLDEARVLAFAGIGRPEKFAQTLAQNGAEVVDCIGFPDHYFYTDADMQRLRDKAEAASARLVTTEKDAVRLTAKWRERVLAVPVSLVFEEKEMLEERLMRALAL